MTSEEMWQLLTEPGRDGLAATVRPDGRLHNVPVWYCVDGNEIVFTTGENSVKANNLRHSPRIAFTVSQPSNPTKYVMVEGEAYFWEAPTSEKQRILGQIYARYGEDYTGKGSLQGTLFVRIKVSRLLGENYG